MFSGANLNHLHDNMLWYHKERRKRMEFIQNYVPTSKAQLLQVAMWYHKGDVGKAQEMVDFYTKNISLPDVDPVQPTVMQQIRGNVSDLYAWVKENQGDLVQGWQFISSLIKNKGVIPTGEAAVTVAEQSLPPINE